MTKVTEGSTLIKEALLADDPRPLWLLTGGGTNTISAALSQVAKQYQNTPRWEAIRKHIIATTHVYIILNQDTLRNTSRSTGPISTSCSIASSSRRLPMRGASSRPRTMTALRHCRDISG
jgi:hypothetical protein